MNIMNNRELSLSLFIKDMQNSLGTMETVMQATTKSLQSQLLQGAGDLAHALAEFDESLIMEPAHFKEVQDPEVFCISMHAHVVLYICT